MTLTEAAPRLQKTKSALGRIETGETVADVHLVRSMMDLYDQYDEGMEEMVRAAMVPGWWAAYGIKDRGFIGLETEAQAVLTSQIVYVPGLLQTEDYIRAVFSTGKVKRSTKQFENGVAARLVRQRRLTTKESPLTLDAVVDEGALRRRIGGPDVMRAQLLHLTEAAKLDTVTIQVVPTDVGAHPGLDGHFTILEFQDDEDPPMLYAEYPTGAVHVEKQDEVKEARLVFDLVRAAALSPADSVALIQRVADEL